MQPLLEALKGAGLLDAGVLATGMERGWADRGDATGFAADRLVAGDARPEMVELAAADDEEPAQVVEMLKRLARSDGLATADESAALRRWMLATLLVISRSDASPEVKLDQLEVAYADFDYPEEMRELSKYHVPDPAADVRVGDASTSPIAALERLLGKLRTELGVA